MWKKTLEPMARNEIVLEKIECFSNNILSNILRVRKIRNAQELNSRENWFCSEKKIVLLLLFCVICEEFCEGTWVVIDRSLGSCVGYEEKLFKL
jgi:hypothetical protein